MYRQNRCSRLKASSRAGFYRVITPTFQYSNYLKVVIHKVPRMFLTIFVMSSLHLNIETGDRF